MDCLSDSNGMPRHDYSTISLFKFQSDSDNHKLDPPKKENSGEIDWWVKNRVTYRQNLPLWAANRGSLNQLRTLGDLVAISFSGSYQRNRLTRRS